MDLQVHPTADAAAAVVHDVIVEQLTSRPNTVLGLPTGRSPRSV